jgi:heptosyltransferase-1
VTSPPRVLIVRLGALGDIIHAIPVAAALRRRWPDARVDWVVESKHAALLEMVPVVSSLVPIDSRRVLGRGGWLSMAGALRASDYDVALDVQGLVKSAVVARLSGARRVVGFDTASLREPSARWLYSEQAGPAGRGHVVARNLGILRVLGIETADWEFPLRETAPSPGVRQVLERHEGRLALMNPSAGWPNKRWPAERFGELARVMAERLALVPLVLWGPGEEGLARAVVEASGGRAAQAPRTTLGDLAALVRAARVVVAGDTGPLHLAAALRTPVVGIYGPTDPARNGPWSAADECVSRREVCECYHKRACVAARWCLLDISVEEVAAAVERRIGGGPLSGVAEQVR